MMFIFIAPLIISLHVFLSHSPLISLDENGKDQGVNVRQKVKEMVEFVQDDERLREERKKAKKTKDKFIGVSSDSMGFRNYCKSSACPCCLPFTFYFHFVHYFFASQFS